LLEKTFLGQGKRRQPRERWTKGDLGYPGKGRKEKEKRGNDPLQDRTEKGWKMLGRRVLGLGGGNTPGVGSKKSKGMRKKSKGKETYIYRKKRGRGRIRKESQINTGDTTTTHAKQPVGNRHARGPAKGGGASVKGTWGGVQREVSEDFEKKKQQGGGGRKGGGGRCLGSTGGESIIWKENC